MKLVEGVTVKDTPVTDKTIGTNQIVFEDEVVEGTTTISAFLGLKDAGKNKEEKTYVVDATTDLVVAYVEESACSDLSSLNGKKIDVIFGKDNKVAYLAIVDETHTGMYVTAYDAEEGEIAIDDEVYELKDTVAVSVFDHVIGNNIATVTTLLTDGLNIQNPLTYITRNIVADFTIDENDEIDTINFRFSANGYEIDDTIDSKTYTIFEGFVVETTKTKIETADGTTIKYNTLEDNNTRIIKDGKVIEADEIVAGDVLTAIKDSAKYEFIYVTSNTVAGTLYDYTVKTNALELEGEDYIAVDEIYYNQDGELKDIESTDKTDASTLFNSYFEEKEVTAYLNMFGEVVAVVGESEATGMVLGVVTRAADADDDANEVTYVKVKILAEDGSDKTYKIYGERKKSIKNTDPEYSLALGDVVKFEADSDRVITIDKIDVINAYTENLSFKSTNKKLTAIVTTADKVQVNGDIEDKELKFSYNDGAQDVSNVIAMYRSATTVLNFGGENAEVNEVIGWEALTNSDTSTYANKLAFGNANTEKVVLFVDGEKLVYLVSYIEDKTAYGASTDMYGILLEVNRDTDENDERIYVATVLVEGEEVTYSYEDSAINNIENGSFIKFNVTDGEFSAMPTVLVGSGMTKLIANIGEDTDYIAFKHDETAGTYSVSKYMDLATMKYLEELSLVTTTDAEDITKYAKSAQYEAIKVESVDDEGENVLVYFEADGSSRIKLEEDYVVYNLSEKDVVNEVKANDYILTVNVDSDAEIEIIIVL